MIISVINKKGGVGKTPFAFSIAKDLDMFLQSNDNSIIESIYPNKSKISKELILLDNCVYDFGGFVEKGIIEILKGSDFIIIPCTQLFNSMLRTIESINEIQSFNKNIIVLITDYKDEKDKNLIEETLTENLSDLSFYYFKHSKIVDNCGRPTPVILRVIQALPLPMPHLTISAPDRIKSSTNSAVTALPTINKMSGNCLRIFITSSFTRGI